MIALIHRCTRVENPGEGVQDVFAKIPRGGSRVVGKIARGGPPILRFILLLPPLCASMHLLAVFNFDACFQILRLCF
jgi:hypothetical protein